MWEKPQLLAGSVKTTSVLKTHFAPFYPHFTHHSFNLIELESGHWMVFDLSAAYNMDWEQNRYNIFAVMAEKRDDVIAYVQELFGGTWAVFANTAIKTSA